METLKFKLYRTKPKLTSLLYSSQYSSFFVLTIDKGSSKADNSLSSIWFNKSTFEIQFKKIKGMFCKFLFLVFIQNKN